MRVRRQPDKPEGPYETDDRNRRPGVSNKEISQLLDFVDQLQHEAELSLSLKPGYSELRILTALMRNHLGGKLSTSSSLVGASGLSYGTAMRALAGIENRGLMVRRPKTATGKSFSLHPTPKLILEWQEFARRTRSLFGGLVYPGIGADSRHSEYYFGSSYAGSNIIPPFSVFDAKLPIRGELRLLVHADPTFMAMHSLKKQFETIFGVGIWSRALSIDRLREEILENAKLPVSRYDIVACDLPWFGEMAEAGRFLPVDSLVKTSELDLSDFHPVALASTRYNQKQYGIPVQTTPELLVCRRDLLEERGLKLPRTIEDTVAAAKALHEPFRGVAGIAWNAARGTPLGHSLLFVAAALGQPVLDLQWNGSAFDCENVQGECFRPMFDSLEAKAAAEYFLELLDLSPRGILNMSWYERARCYADGNAAIAYSATLLAPLFELDKSSPAFGNTEYLPHPVGLSGRPIAPVGGYALAIPSNIEPERIDAIWDALATLTSAQAIKLYIENGSLVSPRFSVSVDPEVQRISPLISIVDEMARTGVLQVWPRPPVPEIVKIIAVAGEEMHDMLLGRKSASAALHNCQNRADALMRARGHY
ncbi:MAG: extracellular solute-binding protein [Albidovulum sp.]|nr:extracellular solute-binding protein [Albidovulum sp.]